MTKISELPTLTTPADADVIPLTDVSDTTGASSGTTKKVTVANLRGPSSGTSIHTETTGITNLNNVSTTGYLWARLSPASVTNEPSGIAGDFLFEAYTSGGGRFQKVTATANGIEQVYFRNYTAPNWSAWERINPDTNSVGRDQLDFAAGTTESSGRAVVLTGTAELSTASIPTVPSQLPPTDNSVTIAKINATGRAANRLLGVNAGNNGLQYVDAPTSAPAWMQGFPTPPTS